MIGRLTQAADFQRLLATPTCARSSHFSLHHLRAEPTRAQPAHQRRAASELSTDSGTEPRKPVDDFWLGCLVPKRHARRAVTRSSLKRQMRAAVQRHEAGLIPGLWLLRLRSPFAVAEFPSADSTALRAAARGELEELLAGLERRVARQPLPRT